MPGHTVAHMLSHDDVNELRDSRDSFIGAHPHEDEDEELRSLRLPNIKVALDPIPRTPEAWTDDARVVFLIGMRGAGKSTLGKKLVEYA